MKRLLFCIPVLSMVLVSCQATNSTPSPTLTNENMNTASGVLLEVKNVSMFANLEDLAVETEEVAYSDGTTGYLARPAAAGTYPAVVMIHEWWGLNEHIKDMARILADEGYVVLAVDLYEGTVATDPTEAGKQAGAVRENPEAAVQNMRDAVAYLKGRSEVQSDRIASLGWCFGGQQSLNLALASDDLAATVIYYGNLVTEIEKLAAIQWPVLGIFGEEDTSIPVETVKEFETALATAGVENAIHIYPGVGHAFANPSGQRFAPEETMDAWGKTLDFLKKNLSDEA